MTTEASSIFECLKCGVLYKLDDTAITEFLERTKSGMEVVIFPA